MPLGTRKLELAQQQATTALRGRRPGDPGGTGKTSFCMGLTGEKQSLSARWRKSIKQPRVVWPISYSSSRARDELSRREGTALRPGRPLLRLRKPRQNTQRVRRGGGASRHAVLPVLRNFLARMASKTPNGCERHPSGTLTGEKSPLSATARLPENKNHKTGHPHEHKNVTFVEQWLLATTLSTLH